ncbi:MAG: beta-lactamase family protein [Oscillospiraceae bacterium]|jgi:CubicO group peptidase (beta-lactamase class C family)|nr:beta-lactamase family protein [Oscillospiraceae bacterium]
MPTTQTHIALPRAKTPEAVGVSSAEVLAFLREVEEARLELHSFMVLRHGQVAAECFRAPFRAEYNHQMWSVSKSVTATAIGFAIYDGLLTLDTRVLDIFPEYAPNRTDYALEKLTVRHLVSMTSGKSPPYLSPKGANVDWLRTYMEASWYNDPGAEFRYINENFYVLCAILVRVTGQSVLRYLTPRLFVPLGIENPFWETDNWGIEAGGWGFYAKTEDLAKLMLCYQQGGQFAGKQVIPAAWAREAVRLQTPCVGLHSSCNAGYGFGFWRNPADRAGDGYRANGMFCQFGINFSDYDAVFVCNSAVTDEEVVHQLIWKHFPAAFFDGDAPQTAEHFADTLGASRYEAPPPVSVRSPLEPQITGRRILLQRKRLLQLIHFPVGVLPVIVTAKTAVLPRQISNITLDFAPDALHFSWHEGHEENRVTCGMDGTTHSDTIRLGGIDYRTLSHALWQDEGTLDVHIRAVETIAAQRLRFVFGKKGKVTMQSLSSPPIEDILGFLTEGAVFLFKFKPLLALIRWALRQLPKFIEPVHKGWY